MENKIVYLSLGSNLGDRLAFMALARKFLEKHPKIKIDQVSKIYETEPWPKDELEDQEWFLNQVIKIETSLKPHELLRLIEKLEKKIGRTQKNDWSSREIDIDILLYADQIMEALDLQIPHLRITERKFILRPLTEITPDLRHPVSGRMFKEIYEELEKKDSHQTLLFTPTMNQKKIAACVKDLLAEIGEDIDREGLKETPDRVAKSFQKLFGGYQEDPKNIITVFDNEGYDEMVIAKDIEFYSMCEHHMLPFFGKVHVGYVPGAKIIGLSKMPRLVEVFARRLQNQERLTKQIAETLNDVLEPKGVGVVIEASHLCMQARGVEKKATKMVTSSSLGLFRKDARTRAEFLELIK